MTIHNWPSLRQDFSPLDELSPAWIRQETSSKLKTFRNSVSVILAAWVFSWAPDFNKWIGFSQYEALASNEIGAGMLVEKKWKDLDQKLKDYWFNENFSSTVTKAARDNIRNIEAWIIPKQQILSIEFISPIKSKSWLNQLYNTWSKMSENMRHIEMTRDNYKEIVKMLHRRSGIEKWLENSDWTKYSDVQMAEHEKIIKEDELKYLPMLEDYEKKYWKTASDMIISLYNEWSKKTIVDSEELRRTILVNSITVVQYLFTQNQKYKERMFWNACDQLTRYMLLSWADVKWLKIYFWEPWWKWLKYMFLTKESIGWSDNPIKRLKIDIQDLYDSGRAVTFLNTKKEEHIEVGKILVQKEKSEKWIQNIKEEKEKLKEEKEIAEKEIQFSQKSLRLSEEIELIVRKYLKNPSKELVSQINLKRKELNDILIEINSINDKKNLQWALLQIKIAQTFLDQYDNNYNQK
ncbi:MAG: hypothetical protein ACD_4C00044G0002 [uncultured bacterium (gcode 4)]|uniref:Uncharacterized protein n=1 Tax=uncultured bacterium (gcode 4) TaxID=1234023 RepID=K2FVX7_9BACT|nr:MAG: hypothetical protein ACD_4C00044G0002 [uncultured bacterium (gcode 4)]